jgi:hypothetical protein
MFKKGKILQTALWRWLKNGGFERKNALQEIRQGVCIQTCIGPLAP